MRERERERTKILNSDCMVSGLFVCLFKTPQVKERERKRERERERESVCVCERERTKILNSDCMVSGLFVCLCKTSEGKVKNQQGNLNTRLTARKRADTRIN